MNLQALLDNLKSLLVSRAAQFGGKLAFAGFAALAAHLHTQADPGKLAGLSADTAAVCASGAGFLFDLLVHYLQHGVLFSHMQEAARDAITPNDPEPIPPAQPGA